jgi:hypothetical protein
MWGALAGLDKPGGKVTQPLTRPSPFYLLALTLVKAGKNFIPFS